MTGALVALLVAYIAGSFPFTEEVDDCQGEWDESYVERSDDIGELI